MSHLARWRPVSGGVDAQRARGLVASVSRVALAQVLLTAAKLGRVQSLRRAPRCRRLSYSLITRRTSEARHTSHLDTLLPVLDELRIAQERKAEHANVTEAAQLRQRCRFQRAEVNNAKMT